MKVQGDLQHRLEAMRAAFDDNFRLPQHHQQGDATHVLEISAAGSRFAVQLTELSGVHADKPLTAVPSGSPEFVGIAVLRGKVLPVFDLAKCVGLARSDAWNGGAESRWLMVERTQSAGFAFDQLVAYHTVERLVLRREEADGRAWLRLKGPEPVQFVDPNQLLRRLERMAEGAKRGTSDG